MQHGADSAIVAGRRAGAALHRHGATAPHNNSALPVHPAEGLGGAAIDPTAAAGGPGPAAQGKMARRPLRAAQRCSALGIKRGYRAHEPLQAASPAGRHQAKPLRPTPRAAAASCGAVLNCGSHRLGREWARGWVRNRPALRQPAGSAAASRARLPCRTACHSLWMLMGEHRHARGKNPCQSAPAVSPPGGKAAAQVCWRAHLAPALLRLLVVARCSSKLIPGPRKFLSKGAGRAAKRGRAR